MKCLECGVQVMRTFDNRHLFECCGLTLQEYAIRHHIPLDLVVPREQINLSDKIEQYQAWDDLPDAYAHVVLRSLILSGVLQKEGEFTVLNGEIRCLEQLLWYQQFLQSFGFKFRQEYYYQDDSHRVIAKNRLKVPTKFLNNIRAEFSDTDFPDLLSIVVAQIGRVHAGYLFLDFPEAKDVAEISDFLSAKYQIRFKTLDASIHENGLLLRTETHEDAKRLLALLKPKLRNIPNAQERFYSQTERATVVKELVFDSAHFITDHSDKCVNLHGGRYNLFVKVTDHVDPLTGFVLDYAYLKRIVKQQVIDKLDHHNLNYVTSELSWRSSTEFLCVFIWEQLIEYLPGLREIQIYETEQSYCCYEGPTLAEFQEYGMSNTIRYFDNKSLGKSKLRKFLANKKASILRIVGQ